jgi:microcystin-dependent protein
MADTSYLKTKVTGIVAPVGTFLSLYKKEDLLECNGQELNISEYPELAEQFKVFYGKANHFGGDGEKTFALPFLDGVCVSVKDIKRYES